jgi:predicted dithiol-disulfide oxidoreductase (DUF899 family)
MSDHPVVSSEEWLARRKALLDKEKAFTRLRDELSAERRALPWVRVDKSYMFVADEGKVTLADLFGEKSQLIVWHFMFHPDWQAGCRSCSFWADSYNPLNVHLNQRDVNLVAISRASLDRINAFKERMGWTFRWVSSAGNDFNYDFCVSFTPDNLQHGANNYNFGTSRFSIEEAPGLSVFCKTADGAIFRTYSCYSRGLDMLNPAYHYLDLVPKGRDEAALSYPMAWVRLHDEYAK